MILAKDIPISLTEVPMAFNQDLKAILPKTDAEPEYFLYALMASKTRLSKDIGTSAHGTRRIGTAALEDWLVPLPPIQEQHVLAEALVAVDRKIEAEEAKRKTLDSLFSTLLHNLMTGKVWVHDVALALEDVG
jgi:type I restriction enzyme S subunit